MSKVGQATQLVGGKEISKLWKVKRAREIKAAVRYKRKVEEDKERHSNLGNIKLIKK